ncbi:MAG: hypothetical protein CL433_07355 [Acidimicrobiaceae bacterium]|jgi:hypothetical protein|nr:hypothetical protein [Acidimicrobiaceae bacterium]HAB57079.1 hypothetical protein [Acidimicrobiaceae bacterium]
MRTTKRSLTIFAMLFSVLVFASACGSSNDPQSWAEAEDDGNLRPNFIRACTEANTDGAEIELTADQIATYCECAFVEIVEYFGGEIDGSNRLADAVVAADSGRDFAAFKELESTLRDNPEDIPADIRAMLTGQGGCTDQALAS